MRWLFISVIAISLILTGTLSSFAQSASSYDVKDPLSGKSYPVNYSITNATVTDMSIDSVETSLVISLQTTGDGTMIITLPRTVIDAKAGSNDDQFFVLEDGAYTDVTESKTSTDRTLTIPFYDGTEKIEIIGTQVVPEFGSLSYVILLISVTSILIFSAKVRLRLNN